MIKCCWCCCKPKISELDKKKMHDLLHAPIVITPIEKPKKPAPSKEQVEQAIDQISKKTVEVLDKAKPAIVEALSTGEAKN
jgi:hypothetical protein